MSIMENNLVVCKVKAGEWANSIFGEYAKVATPEQFEQARAILNNDAYNAPMYVTPCGPSTSDMDRMLRELVFAPTVKPLGPVINAVGVKVKAELRNPSFIAAVLLPNGKTGFQVGPRGMIFADLARAVERAAYLAYDKVAA